MVIHKIKSTFQQNKPIIYSYLWVIEDFSSEKTYAERVDVIGNIKLEMMFCRVEDHHVYFKPFYRFVRLDDSELCVKVSYYYVTKREQFDVIGSFAAWNKGYKDLGIQNIPLDEMPSHLENGTFSLRIEVHVASLQEANEAIAAEKEKEITTEKKEEMASEPEKIEVSPSCSVKDEKLKILKGLLQMKANELLSDFPYHVDGKKFPVHKMMLAARSPVFLKMFCTDFKESKEANLYDISKAGFEEFINFIYSGEVENLEMHAMELLMVSDKYRVDDLKSSCQNHLLTKVNEDNALKIFLAAHTYRCSLYLKKKAFECIKNFLSKWNYILPEEFLDASKAVAKLIMMKTNFENGLKLENAQAEIMENSNSEEENAYATLKPLLDTDEKTNEKEDIYALL